MSVSSESAFPQYIPDTRKKAGTNPAFLWSMFYGSADDVGQHQQEQEDGEDHTECDQHALLHIRIVVFMHVS